MSQQIIPNLWFNSNAKEAVNYYMSVFKDGKITDTDYYTDVMPEVTGKKEGEIVTLEFEILGTKFVAINAGPEFTHSPAVSFSIECGTQEELDYYYDKLSAVKEAEQCGWVQDKFGVSWQIVPTILNKYLKEGDRQQRRRVTEAFMPMKRLNIKDLEKAYKG
jgi:predicted 3-demethylubiquinone-9 3-methyltransferase (glyoxalase superfamily)